MEYEYKETFSENGRGKVIFLEYGNDPPIIDLWIRYTDGADPDRHISLTESETETIARAIKGYYAYKTGGAENG